MKLGAMMVVLGFLILMPTTGCGQEAEVRNAVVKVFTSHNPPDFLIPWQAQGIMQASGSGCIIEERSVLTNAHVVSNHTFVQVKKDGDAKLYSAKVMAIGHDSDLAVLSVEDTEFFQGITPLPFGELPMLDETVTVMGYPLGGEQISITKGVVSRIDVTTNYAHNFSDSFAVQIDAALNPGNSGGPVLKEGKLVGIAYQGIYNANNVGYMIPITVVQHFLADLKDGRYDGLPTLGIDVFATENKTLRQFHEIEDRSGGILVTKVYPLAPASGRLQEGDIIFEIDGVPIASDGTVELRKNERIFFTYLIMRKQIGEVANLKIKRGEKVQDLSIELHPYTPLVPRPYHFEQPPYYIYGGLVFTILSDDLLKQWDEKIKEEQEVPLDLSYYSRGAGRIRRSKDRKDIVVLLHVLADEINAGYDAITYQVVSKLNGEEVKSFKDFVTGLNNGTESYSVIDTEQNAGIILDNKAVKKANERILKKYRIPAQFSEDVKSWLAAPWEEFTRSSK